MLIVISKSGETQESLKKCSFRKNAAFQRFSLQETVSLVLQKAATIIFEVADERPLDSQNIKYNGFFGKLLLLMEYIVQEFTRE